VLTAISTAASAQPCNDLLPISVTTTKAEHVPRRNPLPAASRAETACGTARADALNCRTDTALSLEQRSNRSDAQSATLPDAFG
jgi:hypothetical protein